MSAPRRENDPARKYQGPNEVVTWQGEDSATYNLPLSQLDVDRKGMKKAAGKYIGGLIASGSVAKPEKGTVKFNKEQD